MLACIGWVGCAVWFSGPGVAASAEGLPVGPGVTQVLIIQSFGTDFDPYSEVSARFRSALTRLHPVPTEFTEVSLAAARGSDRTSDAALVTYLKALFTDRRPDLVVPIGGPACAFIAAHRQDLFPSSPTLFAAVDRRLVPPAGPTSRDAVVPSAHDFVLDMESALEVLPGTEDIFIVIGTSPLEDFWRSELERDFQPMGQRVRFHWWNDLAFAEMLRRAAELPPRSAIFLFVLFVDGAGVPHRQQTVLTGLHDVSSAPIFGLFDIQLGEGIVGGPLVSIAELSRRCAEAAAAMLRGDLPEDSVTEDVGPSPPAYDWRELERWGIPVSALPLGSTVRFRPPSPWVLYRWHALVALAVIVILAGAVVALNLHRIRLSAAERTVRALSRRLLTAIEEERRRIGRELHDDISQRLAGLAIDVARVENVGPGSPERAAGLAAVSSEISSLSTDIHALSHWFHPAVLQDLGLVEALRAEADRFSHVESTAVALDLVEPQKTIPWDTGLCLYRITQEALRNIARHAFASNVTISLKEDRGGCELEVRDDGVGFERSQHPGAGLGLASMTERADLVGGRLRVESRPERGTSVKVWVPLRTSEGS